MRSASSCGRLDCITPSTQNHQDVSEVPTCRILRARKPSLNDFMRGERQNEECFELWTTGLYNTINPKSSGCIRSSDVQNPPSQKTIIERLYAGRETK